MKIQRLLVTAAAEYKPLYAGKQQFILGGMPSLDKKNYLFACTMRTSREVIKIIYLEDLSDIELLFHQYNPKILILNIETIDPYIVMDLKEYCAYSAFGERVKLVEVSNKLEHNNNMTIFEKSLHHFDIWVTNGGRILPNYLDFNENSPEVGSLVLSFYIDFTCVIRDEDLKLKNSIKNFNNKVNYV